MSLYTGNYPLGQHHAGLARQNWMALLCARRAAVRSTGRLVQPPQLHRHPGTSSLVMRIGRLIPDWQLAPPLADCCDLALAPAAIVRNRNRLVLVRSRRDDLLAKIDAVRLPISPRTRAGRLRRDGRRVVLERDWSCGNRRRRLVVGCAWSWREGGPPHLFGA